MGRYFLFLPSRFPTLLAVFFFFFCFQGPCLSAGPETTLMAAGSEDAGVEGELTTLQKHVTFFDSNGDGIIYPSETYDGFRSIGVNAALSAASAALIHGALSSKTNPGKTDPRLPIYIKNIKLAKHGSDTGAYDTEGRFVPEKFEEIFTKHAHSIPTALTSNELSEMLKANRQPKDFAGWAAAAAEWKVLYDLCKDKDGLLQKETIRAVYDGSLFEQLKQRNSS
ncbi:probable peroxygenase 5 [Aristolochia californica]|uniref:probable peroxygenase 5 n=1 Tax=Aristolochia californica TaxID=171875 RepID=UPI0035D550A6